MSAQFSRGIFVIAIMAMSSFLTAADEPPAGVVATLKGHTEALYAVAFSPDSKLIATGSFDKTIKLWDLSGKEIRTLNGPTGHQNLVLAVAVPKFRLEICPHSPFLSGFDRSHCGTKKSGLVAAVPVGVQDRVTLIALSEAGKSAP